MALAVTPVIVTPTIVLITAPVKLLPKSVTGRLVPGDPLDGLIEVSVGPVPVTCKVIALLVPFRVDTTTLFDPTDVAVKFAVI